MRTLTSNDGTKMLRRVIWKLADWPRVRDLNESLVWVRSRLVVPEPVVLVEAPEILFGVVLAQDPDLLLPH